MKKLILLASLALAILTTTSCVSMRRYDETVSQLDRIVGAYHMLQLEKNELETQLSQLLVADSLLQLQLTRSLNSDNASPVESTK